MLWGIVQRQDPGFWCRLRGFESLCPSHAIRAVQSIYHALNCFFISLKRNTNAKYLRQAFGFANRPSFYREPQPNFRHGAR